MATTLELLDDEEFGSNTFVSLGQKNIYGADDEYEESKLFPINEKFEIDHDRLPFTHNDLNQPLVIRNRTGNNTGDKTVRLIGFTGECKDNLTGGCEITVVEDTVTGDIKQTAGKRSTRKRSTRKRSTRRRSTRRRSTRRRSTRRRY